MVKQVLLLGATGSIGENAIEIALAHPDKFAINTLVANSNVAKLAASAKSVNAKRAVIRDESKYSELKDLLKGSGIDCAAGDAAVIDVAGDCYDITISAIVGVAGLRPTYRALERSKVVAIANKESMVCAGEYIKAKASAGGVKIVPIDSEHTSLIQIMERDNLAQLRSVSITASGGAFRDMSRREIELSPARAALKHPNWSMGNKITIDSATLANKGLEVIEAIQFLDLPLSSIKVLVHRQSIIHALASYSDGTTIAHMGVPDMKTSIAYAMTMPQRIATGVAELDLLKIARLDFQEPDFERFPMLKIALEIAEEGPAKRSVYNVSNELAVAKYLKQEIGFYDINKLVEEALAKDTEKCESFDALLDYIERLQGVKY